MSFLSNSETASVDNGDSDGNSDNNPDNNKPTLTKIHTMTVCMVPPPQFTSAWEAVTKVRTELKDPGLFRWPPHVNLLYPFLNINAAKIPDGDREQEEESIHVDKLKLLAEATKECEPFRVALDSFGTFGGKSRGVLYLRPRSFAISLENKDDNDTEEMAIMDPLIHLQSTLFQSFPECPDQHKQGTFTPHMTVTHYPSLDEALEGQAQAEAWWSPVEFDVTDIYLLKRVGDNGQFQIVATLPLGKNTCRELQVHDPPLAFPDMPLQEEDWVREERMKMKARRNGNSSGRRGSNNSRRRGGQQQQERRDRGPSRSTDTPQVIAQKRAERAAKRERLAREAAEAERS